MAVLNQILSSKKSVLAYALPLLLSSLLLLFAGTFLTLDRTRSFVPLDDSPDSEDFDFPQPNSSSTQPAQEKSPGLLGVVTSMPGGLSGWEAALRGARGNANSRAKVTKKETQHRFLILKHWRFEGGVGGSTTGFVLGVHITTLLALYVSQHTTHTISSAALVILGYILGIALGLLLSRYRWVTLLMTSLGGSYSLTILAALTFHPSNITNAILFCILSALLVVVPVYASIKPLSLVNLLHWSLRISFSALGTFGTLLPIAVLAHVPDWETAPDALWSASTKNPITGNTLALTVVAWIIIIVGIGSDWALWRVLGPCNDQDWDRYLTGYMENLPDREGFFEAPVPLWTRITALFKKGGRVIPGSVSEKPAFFARHSPKRYKLKAPSRQKPNRAVRFDADTDCETVSLPGSYAAEHSLPKWRLSISPLRLSSAGDSEATLLGDGDSSIKKGRKSGKLHVENKSDGSDEWTLEKYDEEADITSNRLVADDKDWKPRFLTRDGSK